jgi:hypothetical protein
MQGSLWAEGLTDAAGFMGGAMLGFGLGRWLGLDFFAAGYSNSAIGGILLVGLGGGLGVQLARGWRASVLKKRAQSGDEP